MGLTATTVHGDLYDLVIELSDGTAFDSLGALLVIHPDGTESALVYEEAAVLGETSRAVVIRGATLMHTPSELRIELLAAYAQGSVERQVLRVRMLPQEISKVMRNYWPWHITNL